MSSFDKFDQVPKAAREDEKKRQEISGAGEVTEIETVSEKTLEGFTEIIVHGEPEEVVETFVNLPYELKLDALTQDAVDILVRKGVYYAVSGEGGSAGHEFGFALSRGGKITPTSFSSKAFRALYKLMKDPSVTSDPKVEWVLREIDDAMGQNGQLVDPEVLISEIADIYWRDDVPPTLRTTGLASLNYIFSFYWGKGYEDAIVKNLDFKNPKNYARTGQFLNCLRGLYQMGDGTSFSEGVVPQALTETIDRVVKHNEGSYLLNARASQLYDQMIEGDVWPDGDRTPFRLSGNMYAFEFEDGLRVSKEEEVGLVEGLISQIRLLEERMMPSQSEIDQAIALGEREVVYNVDQGLYRQRQVLYRKLRGFFAKKIGWQDISIERVDKTSEKTEQDKQSLFDYQFLMSKPMRDRVESDFGIRLSDLSLTEQAAFLKVIQYGEEQYIEYVQTFVDRFGVNGMRTFLASEYDPKLEERIFTFAEASEEEKAKEIFDRYADVVRGAKKFSRIISRQIPKEAEQFSNQVYESFIRRSASLFYAAEKMSTGNFIVGGETVTDLGEAFRGTALLLNILGSSDGDGEYVFEKDTTKKDSDSNFNFKIKEKDGANTYSLKIFIRPRAEVLERGRKSGGSVETQNLQARINFELSLDELPAEDPLRTAFQSTTDYKREKKTVETSVIRFAFDLDSNYNPPQISFDMGRDRRDSETLRRDGDVLGNILSTVGTEGLHLTAPFDPGFSNPEVFAQIAAGFQKYFRQIGSVAIQ